MPDKKLTDKEIVKALECCTGNEYKCNICFLKGNGQCQLELEKSALDLINRLQAENKEWKTLVEVGELQYRKQKAEVEDLEKKLKKQIQSKRLVRKQAKAEAYKEFAERLKERADKLKHISIDGKWAISQYDVDNLLKELVGD